MNNTKIEWTDRTWNPVRGCSRVSSGCVHCYAERQAARFSAEGDPFHQFVRRTPNGPRWTGKVELVENHLMDPLRWRKPCRVFVNSMSDLFHEGLDDEEISAVFAVMTQSPQHTFQILTKRPQRMLEWFSRSFVQDGVDESGITRFGWCHANVEGRWPLPNVWLGVSVEDQATADARIPLLLRTPAAKRFVSYEPALGPVDFDSEHAGGLHALGCGDSDHGHHAGCKGIDWVIVGGESGPGARPFDIAWARNTIRQCKEAGVACFVKQLGAKPYREGAHRQNDDRSGTHRSGTHREKDFYLLKDRKGGDMAEWPEDLRVREFPLRKALEDAPHAEPGVQERKP